MSTRPTTKTAEHPMDGLAKLGQLDEDVPEAREAERVVLSAVLGRDATALLPELRIQLGDALAFYSPSTRLLWELMCEQVDSGKPVTFSSLVDVLRTRNQLEKVGGPAEIAELQGMGLTLMDLQLNFAVQTLREKYTLRKLIAVSATNIAAAQTHGQTEGADLGALVSTAEGRVFELVQELQTGTNSTANRVIDSNTMGMEWAEVLQEIVNSRGRVRGIQLGIADLDRTFGGFGLDNEGDLLLIAALSGMGKSVAGVSFLESIGIEQGLPTLVFPLEMGRLGYMHRLVPGRALVNTSVTRSGMLSRFDQDRIHVALQSVRKAPIYWDNSSFIEIAELRAKVQVAVRKHGVKCIIIDHFDQIRPSTNKGKADSLEGEREIMRGLHAMRRELNVFVILLMQLSKAASERPSHALPQLGDIKGAGEKYEYATHVVFLNRKVVNFPWHKLSEEKQTEWEHITERYIRAQPECWADGSTLPDGYPVARKNYEEHAAFCVRKNRHGATPDQVCVRFRAEFQRFTGRTTKLYSNNADYRQVELLGF